MDGADGSCHAPRSRTGARPRASGRCRAARALHSRWLALLALRACGGNALPTEPRAGGVKVAEVHLSPTCTCCTEYVANLRRHGWAVHVIEELEAGSRQPDLRAATRRRPLGRWTHEALGAYGGRRARRVAASVLSRCASGVPDCTREGEHLLLRRIKVLMVTTLVVAFAAVAPVGAAVPVDTSALVAAVDAGEINQTLADLQAIADANNDTRASGTSGYSASVDYIVAQLEAAGYEPVVQEFEFEYFEVLEASLEQLDPPGGPYVYGEDFIEGFGSVNGTAVGDVVAIDVLFHSNAATTSTSGCELADFAEAGFETGDIALIQRGTCNFTVKVANAEEAGAAGVIIFNEGNAPDRMGIIFPNVTGSTIPVVGTSFELGQDLVALSEAEAGLTMRIALDFFSEMRTTWNVLADLQGERDDRVVLVGAHLDSVLEGPGINDNGSGSATILEIAEEMAALGIQPVNTVRFAWWGAEESGLLGAEYYVSQLSKSELKDIAVNLNFDMVGSTNFVRFVYDGDAGPVGSGVVEDVFLDWFASQGLATEPTEFDGRSDYGPFILQGVPAGGLFTGAEGIKTPAQVAIYGGVAGEQYDPCYHESCDDITNISLEVLEQMADAAAHATYTFAMTSSAVSGTAKGNANGHFDELEFTGSRANR